MSEPREPEAANPGGRPPALDEQDRRVIIALLANGSSRRMAAGYVGCSPATLMRAMDRDADFAAAVARAERSTEIDALRRIKAASQESRYWRAAAWLLERRNPEEFAQRPPQALTAEQIAQMFRLTADPFIVKMSDKDFFEAVERLESLMEELQIDPRRGTSQKVPFLSVDPVDEAAMRGPDHPLPPDADREANDGRYDDEEAAITGGDDPWDSAKRGSFGTDPSDEPCVTPEEPPPQTFVAKAVQVVPTMTPSVGN